MEWVKLGDHITQIRGVSYSKSDIKSSPCDGYVGLLRADAIQDGNIIETNLIYVKEDKVSENQYLRDGDILVATSSGSKNLVGKAAQFTKTNKDLTFGAFCKVVRTRDLNKDFLKFFFKSSYYKNTISNLSAGANINNIRNSDIDELDIVLYEEQFEADLVKRLNIIENLISTRKAQITALDELNNAFFGQLIKSNFSKKELYSVLDKDIKKINSNYINPISYIDISSIDNYKNEIVKTNEIETVKDRPSRAKQVLKKFDVLISTVRPNLKNIAMLTKETDYITIGSTGFSVLRPLKEFINEVYLFYYVKSDIFTAKLNSISSGANYPAVKDKDIKSLEIPLPPLELQEQFAAKVETIEAQKAKLQTSLEEMEILFDALMQEAFSGNLG